MIAIALILALTGGLLMANLWVVRKRYLYTDNIGRSMRGRGYIYFFRGARENLLHVKIGRSTDPVARLKAFKTANPYGVHVYAVVRVRDPYKAERYIHRKFANQRLVGGEWFWWSLGLWFFMVLVRDRKLTKETKALV